MKTGKYLLIALALGTLAAPSSAGDSWFSGSASGTKAAAPAASAPRPDTLNLKCSACYSALGASYNPASAARLKSISSGLTAPSGYTGQEARNYFEATGKDLAGAGLAPAPEAAKAGRPCSRRSGRANTISATSSPTSGPAPRTASPTPSA